MCQQCTGLDVPVIRLSYDPRLFTLGIISGKNTSFHRCSRLHVDTDGTIMSLGYNGGSTKSRGVSDTADIPNRPLLTLSGRS